MSWKKKDKRYSVWYLSFLFNKIVNKRVSLCSIFLQCFVMKHWEMLAVSGNSLWFLLGAESDGHIGDGKGFLSEKLGSSNPSHELFGDVKRLGHDIGCSMTLTGWRIRYSRVWALQETPWGTRNCMMAWTSAQGFWTNLLETLAIWSTLKFETLKETHQLKAPHQHRPGGHPQCHSRPHVPMLHQG